MGKKGRRGRSRKTQARSRSAAPVALDQSPATLPSAVQVDPIVAMPPVESAGAPCPPPGEPSNTDPAEATPAPVVVDPRPDAESVEPTRHAAESASESASSQAPPETEPEPSVPPAGDLDARFFEEAPSEAWLAHELELRDPHFLRKMTAGVARRRAHLARYVLGVVGVAVALCLAALVKSAVPASDDSQVRPAAQMAMPAGQPEPPAPAAAPAEPAGSEDGIDGGG
jgi:hypothetical protein